MKKQENTSAIRDSLKSSNYDITSEKMRKVFLQYPQEKMISKFSLEYDEVYLYQKFLNRPYRIQRETGVVTWSEDGFQTEHPGNYNEIMSLYDFLCTSKENCRVSGRFTAVNNLKGTVYSAHLGKHLYDEKVQKLRGKAEAIKNACQKMQGIEGIPGDVCYQLPAFSQLPILFRFYDADEEFPANFQILWDENTLDFVHYETTYYILEELLDRLIQFSSQEM